MRAASGVPTSARRLRCEYLATYEALSHNLSNRMLKLAAEKGVKPIIDEILPMSEAAKAIEAVKNNKVRYRFVLKQDLK